MSMTDKAAGWIMAAARMRQMNPAGALHAFAEDGNCEDYHLKQCLADPTITAQERLFCTWMLEAFSVGEREAIWELTNGPE